MLTDEWWVRTVIQWAATQRSEGREVTGYGIYTKWFARITPAKPALSAAHRFVAVDVPRYQSGWQKRSVDGHQVFVQGDRVVPHRPGQCEAVTISGQFYTPRSYALNVGGSFVSNTGFFHMFSSTPREWPQTREIVKIYMNAEASIHMEVADWARQVLDGQAIPFELKADVDAKRCGRIDSTVFYFDSQSFEPASELLVSQWAGHSHIGMEAPPFTLKLGPGIAAAPEPPDSSYGVMLCDELAMTISRVGADLDEAERVWWTTHTAGRPNDWPAGVTMGAIKYDTRNSCP